MTRSKSARLALNHIIYLCLSLLLLVACNQDQAEALPVPPLILEPPPTGAADTLAALSATELPERDLVELAARLKGVTGIERVVPRPEPERVGDSAPFWFSNHDTGEVEQVNARLAYQSDLLNLWVEEGERVNDNHLFAAAEMLENKILPRNRAFFGSEWQPGVDDDPRLNILHLENIGEGVVGFFSAADEFPQAIAPYSNERELLYTSLRYAPVGSDAYYDLIAHEMQHMIHWYTDSNETTWLNEGLAVLAAHLNGFPSQDYISAYAAGPDVQLNNFSYSSPQTEAHYGAAFFFSAYFMERFGEAATQILARHPENGPAGFEAALAEIGADLTFDDLFADWLVANYLDSINREVGDFGYAAVEMPALALPETITSYPAGNITAVFPYAGDYLRLQSETPLTVVFTGTQQTQLLDTLPHSGDYFWTTVPGDNSDAHLTAAFDLGGLEEATLTFRTWYDIEEHWDYGYVAVSPDEGRSWQLLETEATTTANPQGNSYGPALTGTSGDDDRPVWVQQSADLSPYAGGPVWVRFEYVTDDAIHEPGWALDDISIPQLNYQDDVEEGAGVWTPAGFARHTNILPQSFIVQAILLSDDELRVEPLPLDEHNRATWTLPLNETFNEVILIIAANTPFTAQRATYSYQVDYAATNE
jgi:hypothetical protein